MDEWFLAQEVIGGIAIVCGVIAKWKLGNRDYRGWYWALVGGSFWTIFSCLVGSPVFFLNNTIYFVLSIRGLMLWQKDMN